MSKPLIHNQAFRPVNTVMDLNRLGTLYPYPLSFMRIIIRRIMSGDWKVVRRKFDLDQDGFGEAIYEVDTGRGIYNFVVFSHYLDDANRTDRVIAEAWDMTATFCAGELTEERLQSFRENVPLQEAGRVDANCMVLTRANKSGRVFNHVVEKLSQGEQPDLDLIAKVGYLFRTTAVYGSGKFGMADWEKVCLRFPEFASPFMAEMLVCFLIRQFSIELTEYVAAQKGGESAVPFQDDVKRYLGIGNATGLGMAPYLITHPKLIANWISIREQALGRVLNSDCTRSKCDHFLQLCNKAMRHLSEIETDNLEQNKLNETARTELSNFVGWFMQKDVSDWSQLMAYAKENCAFETQELINSLLMELYKEDLYDLEAGLCVEEVHDFEPAMTIAELRSLIRTHYDWALAEDYDGPDCRDTFWYRSEEKMEPRLGKRSSEPGAEKEMYLGIGYAVKCCLEALEAADDRSTVADFTYTHPECRYIIRRIQTMARSEMGEIRANLLHADVLPIQLLRCKLSFFGVGKFDPRSRLWVRNTMFQGAPVMSDIGQSFHDDWCFPVRPHG